MPNWKKVITSGSNASLNQITASAFQFIGSGTAELEVQGNITASGNISASFTSTGSFGRLEGNGSGLSNITSTVDIDSLSALGGTGIAQSDKLLFSDAGTEKSITFSNLEDAIFGNVSGDATIAAGGALTIADDGVETDMIGDEQVTLAKLAHAAANTVLVRDANSAGDPSFKAVTNTQILIGDGTGFTAAALSGDVTMTNGGVVTIGANAVEGSMLNTNVAGTGLTVAGNNIDVDAAQTQITSVGTLTGLFVDSHISASGNISASGTIFAETSFPQFNKYTSGSYNDTDFSTGGDAQGDVVYFGAGSLSAGDLYYLATSGTWTLTDASDNTAGADELLGVALGSNPAVDGVLLRGFVRMAGAPAGSNLRGRAVYMSETAGNVTTTAPSSTDNIIRVCGYLADNNKKQIWFNPSSVWVKHS